MPIVIHDIYHCVHDKFGLDRPMQSIEAGAFMYSSASLETIARPDTLGL